MSDRPSDHVAVLRAVLDDFFRDDVTMQFALERDAIIAAIAALAPVTPASGGAVPERGVDAAMVERAAVVYAAHADNPDQSVYLPAFRAALIAALTPAGSVPDGEG